MQGSHLTRFRALAARTLARLGFSWSLTVLVLCIDVVWMLAEGRQAPWRPVGGIAMTALAFVAPLAFRRYRTDARLRSTLPNAALLFVFLAVGATLSYLGVSTNAPLVDSTLSAWDRALGFDWLAVSAWLAQHPTIRATLGLAYSIGLVQLAFVVLFLGLSARPAQLDEFMRLFIASSLVSIVISCVLPAAGTWKYYALTSQFNASMLAHFELMRDGLMRDIPLGHMQGIISFPSMHSAMAVLLANAMRGTRLFPLFVVLNAAMLASTPIDGGHYLVDVIAGVALALGLIVLDRRLSARPALAATRALPRHLEAAVR